jgi:hypothetical protein
MNVVYRTQDEYFSFIRNKDCQIKRSIQFIFPLMDSGKAGGSELNHKPYMKSVQKIDLRVSLILLLPSGNRL